MRPRVETLEARRAACAITNADGEIIENNPPVIHAFHEMERPQIIGAIGVHVTFWDPDPELGNSGGGCGLVDLEIDWGDGESPITKTDIESFVGPHNVYDHPGTYDITIRAIDTTDPSLYDEKVLSVDVVFDESLRVPGDAMSDGRFDSADLVWMFKRGKFETGERATWNTGDFNDDGVFDTTDLVLAMQAGGYKG